MMGAPPPYPGVDPNMTYPPAAGANMAYPPAPSAPQPNGYGNV